MQRLHHASFTRREIVAASAAGVAACSTRAVFAEPIDHRAELLRVGPGREYPTLTLAGCRLQQKWSDPNTGAALANPAPAHLVISPGPPGYYVNDSGSHSRRWPAMVGWPPWEGGLTGPVVIEGEPGRPAPHLQTDGYADGVLYYQAGLFITNGWDAVFRHLHFSGFRRQDGQGNYAAVRLNPQNGRTSTVLFEDVEIDGCDNGIMGGEPGLNVVLRRVYLHDNGNDTGRVHNAYIGNADSLTAENLLSTRCTIGHLLKSRAARTSLRNTRLLGDGGTESACLDLPDAGVLSMAAVVCEKSAGTDANWLIHYAGENQDANGIPFHQPSSITIRDLTLIAPPSMLRHPDWGAIVGFANQSGRGEQAGHGAFLVTPEASDVKVFGLTRSQAGLPDVTILPAPPALDLKSPVVG